jgi:hypothetical protein
VLIADSVQQQADISEPATKKSRGTSRTSRNASALSLDGIIMLITLINPRFPNIQYIDVRAEKQPAAQVLQPREPSKRKPAAAASSSSSARQEGEFSRILEQRLIQARKDAALRLAEGAGEN